MFDRMLDRKCRVLVVDDEPQILRYLRATLGTHGFEVLEAASAQECETLAASHHDQRVGMLFHV